MYSRILPILAMLLLGAHLSSQHVGINTDTPDTELDVRAADGAQLNLGDTDNLSFFRLYSRYNLDDNPGLWWKPGQVFRIARAESDGANYSEFLRLDGKTIGIFNTGGSIFIGADAGSGDALSGTGNVGIGQASLFHNTDRAGLVAVGDSALFYNGVGQSHSSHAVSNTAFGSKSLFSNTTGSRNSASGSQALRSNTSGTRNTAHGTETLFSNTTGSQNTAVGNSALHSTTTGDYNNALGNEALYWNTTGSYNTAMGDVSLRNNQTGSGNSAYGRQALYNNTMGHSNTAIGSKALFNNTDRSNLVAIGDSALYWNGVGASLPFHATVNTAVGSHAMKSNTTGAYNVAIGAQALQSNTSGRANTAVGAFAAFYNEIGSYNTIVGENAFSNNISGHRNCVFGFSAAGNIIDGQGNVVIGDLAARTLVSGNSNVYIGESAGPYSFEGTGHGNVGIGSGSLGSLKAGQGNTALGISSGDNIIDGNDNVFVGNSSGVNTTGSNNTVLGTNAGWFGSDYSGCVFIGNFAGLYELQSNRLHIENSDTTAPLIYGEFDNDLVRINGDQEVTGGFQVGGGTLTVDPVSNYVGINKLNPEVQLHVRDPGFTYVTIEAGSDNDAVLQLRDGTAVGADDQWTIRRDASAGGNLQWRHSNFQKLTMTPSGNLGINLTNPNVSLDVNGDIEYTGTITDVSDIRLKKDIESLHPVTNAVNSIRAVSYEMRHDEFPDWNFQEGREYGVIAQELEPYFPELVKTDPEGYKSVDYIKLTVVLLKAIQEQHQKIRQLEEHCSVGQENARKIAALEAQVYALMQSSARPEVNANRSATVSSD